MQEMWVYSGTQGMVNATAVPLRDGRWLVVDSGGSPADGEEFARRVQERGEVALVFVTHEHGDHYQGNQWFRCPVISSSAARQAMLQSPGLLPEAVPSVAFSDQLELHCGEPLLFQRMGGHCPGVSTLYFPERKLLFTGDLVFNGRMPWMGQADFRLWIANLAELLSWDVQTVVPGHGPVGGKEILAAQRDYLQGFQQQVQRAGAEGRTAEQIYQQLTSQHPVPERWQEMLRRAIDLAQAE